ncbi:ECF RNA polymerase sigma factor SigG [Baekduia alba]|uniref:sigma-70 family RNA polymerase sigma factor n=1 Tax=Baekduia alba TaxID=2997333 RepID=UPI00234198FF|nr:sigma-70 family RNA polymerase sigma factor [Baekduia alba]WCB96349.1 ECF RNA polymerase sigma factor SigG [Baekduia alba]
MTKPSGPAVDTRLLEAARRGDHDAFRALVAPHLAPLHRHCYRMLASAHDAEDAVQDALLRAWRALPRFEGRSSFRSWLYRIATNTALTMINHRAKRVLRLDNHPPGDPTVQPEPPIDEPVWLEPIPEDFVDAEPSRSPEASAEQRETLELAFVAALQHLPPRQRAALILRDVMGFSGSEVAEMLETVPSSVYSLLQRAHQAVDERVPPASQQHTLRELGDQRVQSLASRYVTAWETGDVEAFTALLTEDVVLTMPPRPTWFQGREAVTAFAARGPLAAGNRWRMRPTRANGQVAFGSYLWDAQRGEHLPHCLQVLALHPAGAVAEVVTFLDTDLFERFDLPERLGTP